MITEESFIDFKCPYCGGPVSFPRECAGFVQACPDCLESLIVPDDGSEIGKAIPLPINTARLALRRFAPGDWKGLQELFSDEELFRYAEGRPLEEDEILRWLESDSHIKLTTPGQVFCLAIEERETARMIGYMGLNLADPHRLQAGRAQLVGNPGAIADRDRRAGLQEGLHLARGAARHMRRPLSVVGGQQLHDRARLAERAGGEHKGVVLEFQINPRRLCARRRRPASAP